MIETQLVPVPFGASLDSKTDPNQLQLGKLLTAQNVTSQNPPGFDKRNGYKLLASTIADGGTLTTCTLLSSFKNELVLSTTSDLYSYLPSHPWWAPSKGASQPQVQLSTYAVNMNNNSFRRQDSAYDSTSNLSIFVYEDGSGNYQYSVMDHATKTTVVTTTFSGPIADIRVVYFAGYFVLIWADGANRLFYGRLDVNNPAGGFAAVQIAANVSGGTIVFDAQVVGPRLYIAYNASTANTLEAFLLDSSFATSAHITTATGGTGAQLISVFGNDAATNIWVCYYNGTDVKAAMVTSVFAAFAFNVTVETIANVTKVTGIAPTTIATVYYSTSSIPSSAIFPVLRATTVTNAGSVGSPGQPLRSLTIEGRPFIYQSVTYLLMSYLSNEGRGDLQSTYFMVNLTHSNAPVMMKLAQGVAGSGQGPTGMISAVNTISTGVFQFPYLAIDQSLIAGGSSLYFKGVRSAEISFNTYSQSVELGNALNMSGGLLTMYDGAAIVEQGFNVYPEIVSVTPGAAGATIGPGTLSYVATYEWIDNQGQKHISAPSEANTITLGASVASVSIIVNTLRITQKSNVNVTLYRTAANGTIYYEVAVLANILTANSVTFTDTTGDAALLTQLELYTTGGEVENVAPPAPLAIFPYKDRLVLIPAEAPNSWWFSKEVSPGLPIQFSDFLVQNETQVAGPFVGGAQMDDKEVFFKNSSVFYVVGNGPAPNGTGNDYTPAQQIVTETGCNNVNSIVLTPDGLMYQSPKGIYLLDRSLKDAYIGAEVEAYNSDTVVTAKLIPNTTQVRFVLVSGTCLTYDYLARKWSTFTNHIGVASTIWQNLFTYSSVGASVYQETPGVYNDNTAFIPLKIVTPWISLAQIQGYQRLRKVLILGTYESAHTLQVQIAYDYNPTIVQTDIVTASSTPPYQYRFNLQRQKCEAVQLTIQDGSSTGESVRLSSMMFEVAVKKGPNRMAPTRSYG